MDGDPAANVSDQKKLVQDPDKMLVSIINTSEALGMSTAVCWTLMWSHDTMVTTRHQCNSLDIIKTNIGNARG